MHTWLSALAAITTDPAAPPAILITVAAVKGSSPRETGAKMVIDAKRQFDTIGGGHLELRACEIAREMLALAPDQLAAQRRLERFALGPSLGQCCGGVVHLAFERIDAQASGAIECLQQRWRERHDSWRLVALDAALPALVCDRAGRRLQGPADTIPDFDPDLPCRVMVDAEGGTGRWLVDPCLPYRAHLFLFGAGHVGAAIVRALAELPCHVTWIDQRDDLFPSELPANVQIEVTDIPQALIDAAAPGSCFLVMTHSHALDQLLAEHILRRGDAGWFGLIGSRTKRMQFEHRLRERGIADAGLRQMTCPIGLPGIHGKQPAVIAAAVAAQLLQLWDAAQQQQQQQQQKPSRALRLAGKDF
jgi:xanthine dehydrogenase accessory factor